MSEEKRTCPRFVTFYSYKGGTGRSMALANVAWLLAAAGRRVLVLDWDLEAPGLHRYFRPFLVDAELTASDGIIDLVAAYADEAVRPHDPDGPADWYLTFTDLLPYTLSLDWSFPNGGCIDFVPSGRQGRTYAERVNSFDWNNFFERLGGASLLREVRRRLQEEDLYDYVLIDSRTGVSDTAGICTVELPDDLVTCFTLNHQSIEGAAAIACSVREQRPEIRVFPVPMRIDQAEKEKLQAQRRFAQEQFLLFPHHLDSRERARYWREMQVPYWPYYSYEEVLAVFGDVEVSSDSLIAKYQLLASYLTDGEVDALPEVGAQERRQVLAAYQGGRAHAHVHEPPDPEAAAEAIFHRFPDEEQDQVRYLFTRLVRLSGSGEIIGPGDPVEVDRLGIEPRVVKPFVAAGLLGLRTSRDGVERIELAAEELVEWPRLLRWVDEERDFLLWQARLQRSQLEGFDKEARESVLPDPWMRDARQYLPRLSGPDRAYVTESVSRAHRRRALRLALLGLTLAALLTTLLAFYSNQQRAHRTARAAGLASTAAERITAGDWEASVPLLREARALDPSSVEIRRRLAEALVNTGRPEEALEVYDDLVAQQTGGDRSITDAEMTDLLLRRASVHQLQKEPEKAVQDLDRAVGLSPERHDVVVALGETLQAQGNTDEALEVFGEAVRLAPDNADVYFSRATTFASLGNTAEASKDYRTVLGLATDPQTREAACARLRQLNGSSVECGTEADGERVYVHYQDAEDRRAAELVGSALATTVNVVEVERIPGFTRGDVRYFFDVDRETAEAVAKTVAGRLAQEGILLTPEVLRRDPEDFRNARPGRVEVWLPSLTQGNFLTRYGTQQAGTP